jgi:hypothetical protein
MGDRERFGVLLLVDVHFYLGTEGRPVRETQRERKRRKVGGALLKVGLFSTTTVAALAFASAARAEDQPAPPPVLLEESALIVPEDGGVEGDDAVVPVDVVLPTAEVVDAVEPLERKKPAKRAYERRARPVRVRVVTARDPRRHVIPVSRAASRPVPKRVATKPAAHTPLRSAGGWYQIVPSQYRPVEHKVRPSLLTHVKGVEEPVAVQGVTSARSQPRTASIPCGSLAEKCLELCASDVIYNGSQNGPAIWRCISPSTLHVALEKIHQIIVEGLHEASASARANAAGPRYQCAGAQYHAGVCADGAHVAVPTTSGADATAGHLARLVVDDTSAGTPAVADQWRPRRVGSVLGVAVRRTHAEPAMKVRAPSARLTGSQSRRPATARPLAAATADQPFDDWFLRSLLALMGIATVGVLLAILFELDSTGKAVTTLRSRIGSRGLSASRIALGVRARPGDGIHYRE